MDCDNGELAMLFVDPTVPDRARLPLGMLFELELRDMGGVDGIFGDPGGVSGVEGKGMDGGRLGFRLSVVGTGTAFSCRRMRARCCAE